VPLDIDPNHLEKIPDSGCCPIRGRFGMTEDARFDYDSMLGVPVFDLEGLPNGSGNPRVMNKAIIKLPTSPELDDLLVNPRSHVDGAVRREVPVLNLAGQQGDDGASRCFR
jgi:hypothetical protein